MPVKKSSAKKKPVKKAKPAAKKKPKLVCGVCGMSVTVDNVCGTVEEHPIICCGLEMHKK
jgi:hypothetical protein